MARILITGAGRGIGLELTHQYLEAGDQVIACVRDPASCRELGKLAEHGAVEIVKLDLADFDTIGAAREVTGDVPVDVLINNAGYVGGARQTVDDVDIAEWHRHWTSTPSRRCSSPGHSSQTSWRPAMAS
jgi:NAD(P)-dependent dehydrogenase (short-subunit alcohol dehydrogenase family)